MLESLAAHYTIDTNAPFERTAGGNRQHRALRLGQGPDQVPLPQRERHALRPHAPFEGIIPSLERRYRETDSMAVREELSKYLNNKPCPECGGMRLRREARHVFIGGKTISDISRLSLIQCRDFFNLLQLAGPRPRSARRSSRKSPRGCPS
jgi:excinuclease ABC subunit A